MSSTDGEARQPAIVVHLCLRCGGRSLTYTGDVISCDQCDASYESAAELEAAETAL